jgi:hypothetical protein
LAATTQALDQIAGWNVQALDRAAALGDVYVYGRALSGDQVTDDPWLVTAKLANQPVPAPDATVAGIRDQYRRAAVPAQAGGSPPSASAVRRLQPPAI